MGTVWHHITDIFQCSKRYRGLGKIRHIVVCQLWLKDKVSDGVIQVSKIAEMNKLADILTKHVTALTLERNLGHLHHISTRDRHALMPATV